MATVETVDGKIPDGYGRFGLGVTNPIPINTISAEKSYLCRLRTKSGKEIKFKRYGCTYAPNIGHPIDKYGITAKGNYVSDIYLCPYCKETSDIAPEGFKLIKRWVKPKSDEDKTKKQKLFEALALVLLEYGLLLVINLVVIGVGTAIVRMFDLQYFLVVSSLNALCLYCILLQLIKKYLK